MKVYFSASRAFREQYREFYKKIIRVIKECGCEVLGNPKFKPRSGNYKGVSTLVKLQRYKDMIKLIDKSEISVFEASYPSTLNVGHEITVSLDKGKPVVVVFRKDCEPLLFRGINDNRIIWVEYGVSNLEMKLKAAIEDAKKSFDVRFNFFVSPKILSYLDWVAQKRMEPRSVFLRDLIEKEMKKDKEFKG